jgi:hypothetical protein
VADDVEALLAEMMKGVELSRTENAAILQEARDETGLRMCVGVYLTADQGDRPRVFTLPDDCFITTGPKTGDILVRAADGK